MIRLSRLLVLAGFVLGLARLSAAGPMNMKGDMKSEILSSYVKISAALAADDLAGAKTAAVIVAEHAGMSDTHKDIATMAKAVANAKTIEKVRGAYRDLSAAIEPLAIGEKDYVVMHCPMADSDWVQAKGKTQNPYFGRAMPRCGSPKTMN